MYVVDSRSSAGADGVDGITVYSVYPLRTAADVIIIYLYDLQINSA